MARTRKDGTMTHAERLSAANVQLDRLESANRVLRNENVALNDKITAAMIDMAKMEQRAMAAENRIDALLFCMVQLKGIIARLQTQQRKYEFDDKKREWVQLAV